MEHPRPAPILPCNLQQVSTLAIRKTITAWMVEDVTLHGEGGLNGRVIQAFPEHFHSQHPANPVKARQWWQQRHHFEADAGHVNQFSCSWSRLSKRKHHSPKAKSSRGRKRSEWVQYLYPKLVEEFDHFKKTSPKFSS